MARARLRATLAAAKTLTIGIVHIWRIVAVSGTRTSVNDIAVTGTTAAHFSAAGRAVTVFRALALLRAVTETGFGVCTSVTHTVTLVGVVVPFLNNMSPMGVG